MSGGLSLPTLPTFLSKVQGRIVTAIRDTGATTVFVDQTLVPRNAVRCGVSKVCGIEAGFKSDRPNVRIHVDTPYFSGEVWAVALERPASPLVIGNWAHLVEGGTTGVSTELPPTCLGSAKTIAALLHPTLTPIQEGKGLLVDHQTARALQASDPSLTPLRKLVGARADPTTDGTRYVMSQGLLYRVFTKGGRRWKQLMVPVGLRATVLKVGHITPTSGHSGAKRTQERIWQQFAWPGMSQDIRQYCRSCPVCRETPPSRPPRRPPKLDIGRSSTRPGILGSSPTLLEWPFPLLPSPKVERSAEVQ